MPAEVTEEMVRQSFRQGSAGPRAILVTVTSAHLAEPIRFTDHPGGVTSQGVDYPFLPFSFAFPGASADQPARQCELEIGRSHVVAVGIKTAPKNTVLACEVEMVRPDQPDQVERAFRGATIPTADLEGPTIKFTLRGKSFGDELACSKRYIHSRMPGLFR
jgi:hypothetical protein